MGRFEGVYPVWHSDGREVCGAGKGYCAVEEYGREVFYVGGVSESDFR